jgi:mono/diheme cytochrome c family protein
MKPIACPILIIAALTAALIAGEVTHAQTVPQAGNVANGKTTYLRAGCHACHGTMGHGGPGPRLAPTPIAMAPFVNFVRNGKVNNPRANRNWTGMPPYSTKFLSDAELADMYAYLASIAEPPPPANIPLLSGS